MRISPHFSRSQKGKYRVQLAPTEAAFSRFLKKLLLHQHLLYEMFTELVTTLYETLDGFGQTLALDGKIIPSYATKPNKKVEHDGAPLLSLIESKNIIPVIDIKNQWDKDTLTQQYRDTDLIYTYNGAVSYVDEKGNEIKLAYMGHDKKTDCLRYGFKP